MSLYFDPKPKPNPNLFVCTILKDEDFFERVSVCFDVSKTPEGSKVEPTRAREVAMCLRGDWYMLTAKDGTFPEEDPVKSLDVQVCVCALQRV